MRPPATSHAHSSSGKNSFTAESTVRSAAYIPTHTANGHSAATAANAFIEAKSPLLKQRIEKRMQEYEVLLADLEKLKAQLILERGQKLTEKDIVAFINMILQGDVNDLEFRRRLIDNLVYKVYVSDENTYIYFNIKGGKEIEEITFEDTIAALETVKGVQTRSDPSRQQNPTL